MAAVVYVTWGGRRYSPEFRDALIEWERLCDAEGIRWVVTQGGFNKSAVAASGTSHDGDAVDMSVAGMSREDVSRLVELGRMVGIAVWFRTVSAKWGTRAHGFGSYHLHGVPNGWGHPSASAAAQARKYRQGRDGLAGNGVDSGPGHTDKYRFQTWATYRVAKALGEIKDMIKEGLTVAETNAIMAKLNYMGDQLVAIAEGSFGRDALNARKQDMIQAVWNETKVDGNRAIQELADAKRAALRAEAKIAALSAQLAGGKSGGGATVAEVEAAVQKALSEYRFEGEVKLTVEDADLKLLPREGNA